MDPEERKLIIDLSKRGFLPKSLENEPAIVEAILEENMPQLQKRLNSNQENESDSILGASPTHPRLQNARSTTDANKTSSKIGSIDSQMGGGINSRMESLQQTPPTPEVIVNAPRFNKLSNNPLYHSTKEKTMTAIKAQPSARKLGFGMPSETKTTRLRAAV